VGGQAAAFKMFSSHSFVGDINLPWNTVLLHNSPKSNSEKKWKINGAKLCIGPRFGSDFDLLVVLV
jgi:hypothetical protein